MRRRLSILIPLVLMAVSIVSTLLMFLQEDRENRARIEQHMQREIALEMGQLQSILYHSLTEGDEAEALRSLSLVAMRPGMRTLLVADEQHRVVLSNRFRWKGEPAEAHTMYAEAEAERVVQGGTSRMVLHARQAGLLQGYSPLVVAYRSGGLEKRMGVLYVEADIGVQLAEARNDVLRQSLVFGAITLIYALLIAWLLHRLVSRRVHVLLEAAARLARGDFSVQTRLRGKDELSELGERFDDMAQRLRENVIQRERAVRVQQRMLDTIADGYWMLDDKGCLTDVNAAYCRMSGYTREELLRLCILQLEARETTQEAVQAHMAYIQARGMDCFETQHRRKDGSVFEVEVSATWWRDTNQFIVLIRDNSERKATQEAQEALEEQARIAAVAFEMQDAIMVTDREANIIKVNHAFEEITGYSQEEVLGRNPRIFASGCHDKAFYQAMWQAITDEGCWSGEVWDRRKNGEIYLNWLTITAVKHLGEVTHYMAMFVDITERKKAEEEIRNLAFYDPLTQLPNRRLLQDHLQRALVQSTRSGNYGALIFLDLDHFKVLNDTKGHEYGDRMLVEVAQRLKRCVRETDTVARFGGDEFVVLLESLNLFKEDAVAQAGRIAEKIRELLSRPYELGSVTHQSSPSIGVVLFRGSGVASEELLKQADLAMYQSKESGRNKVSFFEASMQAVLESRTLLEGALRQALPKGELELYYQLQTDEAKSLLGAEVLLRWRSAELGLVSPAEFIPMAEQTNLILPIGRWVLESACRQLKAWESHPVLGEMYLAVNISPVQFHQPDFVHQVKAILEESGADPRKLELELTENLVLEDVEEAMRKMSALKEVGVRFSMDDFGTGYSLLQYLKRLPIDLLKIDQSFVRDILTDPDDAMMVQTIAGMAHSFGFGVLAEGVEEHAQVPSLIARGCGKFQGYLFSRPVPLAEFEKLVGEWKVD